ncbi:MAG: hypothetical protein WBH47_11250 [Streptosporangiaceae bacterium]
MYPVPYGDTATFGLGSGAAAGDTVTFTGTACTSAAATVTADTCSFPLTQASNGTGPIGPFGTTILSEPAGNT